jgi:hypothetical protein
MSMKMNCEREKVFLYYLTLAAMTEKRYFRRNSNIPRREKMKMKRTLWFAIVTLVFIFGVGCAGVRTPVRDEVKVNLAVPVGKVEGNQFTGMRFPFNVSAPPGWVVSTQYPDFMLKLGWEKAGLESCEVFIYNPTTQSNIQIDFEPASRYVVFSQASMENLVSSMAGEAVSDTKAERGAKNITLNPTEPVSLKGLQYAAKKYVSYTRDQAKWESGWIYGFSEPYQIFIIYQLIEKEGADDHPALRQTLNSFEYFPPK